MSHESPTETITVRAPKESIGGPDALAATTDRSRNYVVNHALQQYPATNAWQIERIKDGITAGREGRVRPADDVFADFAAKQWLVSLVRLIFAEPAERSLDRIQKWPPT